MRQEGTTVAPAASTVWAAVICLANAPAGFICALPLRLPSLWLGGLRDLEVLSKGVVHNPAHAAIELLGLCIEERFYIRVVSDRRRRHLLHAYRVLRRS